MLIAQTKKNMEISESSGLGSTMGKIAGKSHAGANSPTVALRRGYTTSSQRQIYCWNLKLIFILGKHDFDFRQRNDHLAAILQILLALLRYFIEKAPGEYQQVIRRIGLIENRAVVN